MPKHDKQKKIKRSLLLVNQASGYLMLDICNAFVESGIYDQVILQTGEINIRPTLPHPKLKIIKSKRYVKTNIITRTLSWVLSFLHTLWIIKTKYRKADLFLVSNPPLNIFVSAFCNNKYSLLIYDIYPDILIAQNIVGKNSLIVKMWNHFNTKSMNKATNLYTISQAMANVISKYVDVDKIKIVDIWAHCEMFKPIANNDNPFLKEHKAENKFIVQYSGNMGYTHDIDVLVDVADLLQTRDDIAFFFIGEGAKKKVIEQKIESKGLKNCIVLPFLPSAKLPYSMGGADIGVVTLDSASGSLSIPSKTFTYFATGSIILGICEANTELASMVNHHQAGACFTKDNIHAIADYITNLADDSEQRRLIGERNTNLSKRYQPINALKHVQ